MRIPVAFGPNSTQGKSRQGGGSLLVNCYAEPTEQAKSGYQINVDPGLREISSVETPMPCRGMVTYDNKLYSVIGETLYRVYTTGTSTAIGSIPGIYNCTFSINRAVPNEQVTITADNACYILQNEAVAIISDVDLPASIHSTCYLDGFTIFGVRDGSFYVSANNNSASIGGVDFAEAERSADGGVRVLAVGEEFWYFGERSLEIFRNSGVGTQPFQPLQGAGQSEGGGCAAPHSVLLIAGVPYWINDTRMVVRAQGYSPQKISTHQIDRDIELAITSGMAGQITAMASNFDGHQFYHLRSPIWAWSYNVTTGLWSKKQSYNTETWRVNHGVYGLEKYYFADAVAGKFYVMDRDEPHEAGEPLVAKAYSETVTAYPGGAICDALNIDVQAGVGRAGEASHIADPKIILRVSHDGGMTYGREYVESLGAQGKWNKQIRFNRLGKTSGAGLKFELSMPAPVDRSIFQASAEIRPTAF